MFAEEPKFIRLRLDRRLIRPCFFTAFTLLELLTVISIISLLLAILLPSLNQIRRQSRIMLGMNNQKQIVSAANLYAFDNDEHFPESVATVGDLDYWNWQEPMMLTGYRARSPRLHRSMSGYLRNYINDADIMFCPNAPQKYKYLKESWEAADDWDNPETPSVKDPVSGTYCFYWNYTGFLEERSYLFRGPQSTQGENTRAACWLAITSRTIIGEAGIYTVVASSSPQHQLPRGLCFLQITGLMIPFQRANLKYLCTQATQTDSLRNILPRIQLL
jgi:type II secretory pathway pseudopilin PulG